jgi:hypothetical protein
MSVWTEENKFLCASLIAHGMSAGDAAHYMGFTRNQVIGAAYRFGWQLPNSVLRWSKPKRIAIPGTNKGEALKMSALSRVSRIRARPSSIQALLDLPDDVCRWPIGDIDKEGFCFCCARQLPGSSYCEEHAIKSIDVNWRPKNNEARKAEKIAGPATRRKEPV